MCLKTICALFSFLFIQQAMAIYQNIDDFGYATQHISYNAVDQKLHTATRLKTREGQWGTLCHEEEEGVTLLSHRYGSEIHLEFMRTNGKIQCYHIPEKFFPPPTPHTQFYGLCFESLQKEEGSWILSVSFWETGYRCLERRDFFWFSRHTHVPIMRERTVSALDQVVTQDVLNAKKRLHFPCLPIDEFCRSINPERGKSLQFLRRLKQCFGYGTNP